MECTLAALIACFSWSGFYLDGGLLYQDAGVYREYTHHSAATVVTNGIVETSLKEETFATHDANNPYGQISLGYELHMQSVTLRLEVSHWSSLATSKDKGVNSVSIGARWYPFR